MGVIRIVFTCASCHRDSSLHPGVTMDNWVCAACHETGRGRSLEDLEGDIKAATLGQAPWVVEGEA